MLLKGATLPDGTAGDVRLAGDTIEAVGRSLDAGEDAACDVVDLRGFVLLPAPAEPHAHLDKALTAERVPNRSGDLLGAIEAWIAYRPRLTFDDIVERATRAALLLLRHGATAIRTHVDVAADVGLRCVEALAAVKADLADRLDLQIVALVSPPLGGRAGLDHQALLREAMAAGADVVGGCPHIDAEPLAALRYCVALAAELDRPLDLHMDETLDRSVLGLADLVADVKGRAMTRVTASHCVSLGVQEVPVQRRVAAEVGEAGVAVVALPQTNLFLQGRFDRVSTPRGLTALRALLDAGVTVAAGGDNLQDPFNLVGRGDPLEAASLLVTAGHLQPEEAYAAVSSGARSAMGLPLVHVAAGSPAELLAIRAASVREAIASASPDRIVFHRGRVVAWSVVSGP
jgi:cytosine deaminase